MHQFSVKHANQQEKLKIFDICRILQLTQVETDVQCQMSIELADDMFAIHAGNNSSRIELFSIVGLHQH